MTRTLRLDRVIPGGLWQDFRHLVGAPGSDRAWSRPRTSYMSEDDDTERTRGADVIATRNVRRFEDCGLQAIDPWQVARGSAAPA